jgi:hypothetical protein
MRARSRWSYLGIVAVTIAAGLGSRAVAWPLDKEAGDALYATMMFFGVGLLAPRMRTWTAAAIATAVCFAIEGSQAIHVAWLDDVRDTLPGRLVLGRDFAVRDLACYVVGVALGVAAELAIEAAGRCAPTTAR